MPFITYGRIFQIDIELNLNLGRTPLFLIEGYKNETLIHLPYVQIIYTPKSSLRAVEDGTRNQQVSNNLVRVTEN